MASESSLFGMKTSRRLCNASYVILVLAFNMCVLSPIALMHSFPLLLPSTGELNSSTGSSSDCLSLLHSLNYNALASFLLANLCTGAVNLLTDTLSTSSERSIVILMVYIVVFSMPFYFLMKAGLRLKL